MLDRLRRWLTRAALALLTVKSELCAQGDVWRLDDGKSDVHKLSGDTPQEHALELREDDLVVLRLLQRSGTQQVDVFEPDGEVLAHVDGAPGGTFEFALRARASGAHRIQVQRSSPVAAGEYKLLLVALDVLPKQPVAPESSGQVESPRLQALREAMRVDPAAEQAFWLEISKRGSPLVEAANADGALVTFLYRGHDDTRSVSVQLPVFRPGPNDGTLRPLPGSQVWFRSERMPKGTRLSYQLVVNADLAKDTPDRLRGYALSAALRPDPLNPSSLLELPDAEPEAWLAQRPAIAHGQLKLERWKSARLGNERTLGLYQPAAEAGPVSGLLIVLDGERYVHEIPLSTLLDNLIAAHAIRSTAAVLVHNVTTQSRVDELTCRPAFAALLAQELLPYVREQLKLEVDAAHTVLGGASLGGLSAAYTAYRYPEQFRAVLSQSGSFWFWRSDGSDKDQPDWLIEHFERREKLPIRFYLQAGVLEAGTGIGAIHEKNRHFRDVLLERGYEVTFQELPGGHDIVSWRAGLPQGLIALLAPEM